MYKRQALDAFWQNVPARGDRQACPFTLNILFSEQVSGVALSDFTWSGPATPSNPAVVTAGREWSIGITPSIGANAAFTISLNADSVTRASGGTGPPTAVAARPIHIDTRVEPMITWTEPTGVQDRNFSVRIDFGQAITGFASDDVEVVETTQTANASVISINAVTSVTPAGRQYLIVVRPQRNANGTLKLRLKANSIIRSGGDSWPAAPMDSDVITMDTRAELSATFIPPQVQPVNGVFTTDIVFNEDITTFPNTAIALNVGTLTSTPTSVSTNPRRRFRIGITPPVNSGGSISITILANTVGRSTGGTGPAANIVSDPILYETRYRHRTTPRTGIGPPQNAAGTNLPTPVTATEYYIPIQWERDVGGTQFTLQDLRLEMDNRLSGGASTLPTLSNLEQTNPGNTRDFRVKVTNPAGFRGYGSLTLVIRPGSIPDTRIVLGNFEETYSWGFDTEVPAVADWNVPTGTATDTAEISVTFTAEVTNICAGDFSCNITGSSIASVSTPSDNIGPFIVTVNLPNNQQSTAANITLAANSVTSFRNVPGPTTAQTSPNFAFRTLDDVTLQVYPPNGQQSGNFTVGLGFSRTVTGVAVSDFSGWSTSLFTVTLRGSGSNYLLDFTPRGSSFASVINLRMVGTVTYPCLLYTSPSPRD